jgi:hypothetical protein
MSLADELTKLSQLREQGVLTDEEFNTQKAKLLADSADAKPAPAPAAGQRASGGGLSGAAIAGIVGGALMVLTLVVVLIFVLNDDTADGSSSGGGGAIGRAHTSEAIDNLDKIYKGASIYYSTPHVLATGQKVPCQFPSNQGVTPVEGTCCSTGGLGGPDNDQDDRCDSNAAVWDENTWSALTFQMTDQHYFVYAFDAEGTLKEANFRATANADFDCDSIQSTFQRIAFGDEQANFAECALHGAPAMFVDQETE